MTTPAITTKDSKLLAAFKKSWRLVPIVALYRGFTGANRRQWKVFFGTFFLVMFIGNGIAYAGGIGLSDILPLQDFSNGGAKTLAEDIPSTRYSLDYTAGGFTHPIIDTMNGLASTLILTVAELGWIVVVIMSWLLGSAGLFTDSLDISPMLGSAAQETMGWLFPSALAMGAVFTYFDYAKDKGKFVNGFIALMVAAIAAISLAIYPQTWVKGVETSRAIGNEFVIAVTDSAGASPTEPFEYNDVSYSGNDSTQAFTRKATDAVWRSMVVVPWCIAEFGSIETCKTYGKDVLSESDADKRKDIIKKKVLKDVGEDSEAGKYISGKDWSNRLGTTLISCLITVVLGILVASLTIGALLAFVQALFLILLGLFFLSLGMIPGLPRQWCVSWAYMLAGACGSNIVSMLLLSVSIAFVSSVATSGLAWGMQFLLMVAILMAAFSLKQVLGNIVGGQQADSGGGLGRTVSRIAHTMMLRQAFRSMGSRSNSRSVSNNKQSQTSKSSSNNSSNNSSSWRERHNSNSPVTTRINNTQPTTNKTRMQNFRAQDKDSSKVFNLWHGGGKENVRTERPAPAQPSKQNAPARVPQPTAMPSPSRAANSPRPSRPAQPRQYNPRASRPATPSTPRASQPNAPRTQPVRASRQPLERGLRQAPPAPRVRTKTRYLPQQTSQPRIPTESKSARMQRFNARKVRR